MAISRQPFPRLQAPCQLLGRGRRPRDLTFNLCRQVRPSLHSYSNDAPGEQVEGNAQQVQPPNHLHGNENRSVRGKQSSPQAWLEAQTGPVGTHRVAEQIHSEVRVIDS